jgi:hypothetical protein
VIEDPFVPQDFTVPLRVEREGYVLRPLTTQDVENDYDAVMSSRASLRHIFAGYDADWPADDMTLEDNYRDLARHQQDFEMRRGFTYTMETPDGSCCLGCVYIYPCQRGPYDAKVHYWVRDSEKVRGLEEALGSFLRQWLRDAWPFRRPVFPGRDLSWQAWEALESDGVG